MTSGNSVWAASRIADLRCQRHASPQNHPRWLKADPSQADSSMQLPPLLRTIHSSHLRLLTSPFTSANPTLSHHLPVAFAHEAMDYPMGLFGLDYSWIVCSTFETPWAPSALLNFQRLNISRHRSHCGSRKSLSISTIGSLVIEFRQLKGLRKPKRQVLFGISFLYLARWNHSHPSSYHKLTRQTALDSSVEHSP
ncbi:hypothetical protein K469DRAFT_86075 [Zopfia rhizophila CBS 207.26]|uniref:Uncharacterized protein n=1 Tax=Zopfia rhizophila CBS 207.26 TaxID=1314779 RepID=A0A6A6EAA0_9PEZI|nr:hypothetical protein K469DRAFT_86075 [Zopfia rhizophila CBS 207.26]